MLAAYTFRPSRFACDIGYNRYVCGETFLPEQRAKIVNFPLRTRKIFHIYIQNFTVKVGNVYTVRLYYSFTCRFVSYTRIYKFCTRKMYHSEETQPYAPKREHAPTCGSNEEEEEKKKMYHCHNFLMRTRAVGA
jgi:hypothetical protein